MNKSNLVARLSVLTIALTLVTTSLIGGTLAKYTTEVTGKGSATVAKWSFKANEKSDGVDKFTVNLADTADENLNVTNGKIAPGSKGSFNIVIDATGSETALEYKIEFTNIQNQIANLKFYSDADRKNEITDLTNTNAFDGNIALAETNKKVTKTVYWEWKDGVNNTSDTEAGVAAKEMTFDIKVSGTQTVEANPAP